MRMETTLVRPAIHPDRLLAELRNELQLVLTPERYDRERATALQSAIDACRERSARYRRMRRAALRVANPGKEWWF